MSNEENTNIGGWTPYRSVTEEDKAVFNEAMSGFTGVIYTPKEVSTQVVSGVNYHFKCDAQLPFGGEKWEAIVEVYQSLENESHLVGIVRLLKNDTTENDYTPTRKHVLDATEAYSKLIEIRKQGNMTSSWGFPDLPIPIPIPPIPFPPLPIPDLPDVECIACKAGLALVITPIVTAAVTGDAMMALIPVMAEATGLPSDIVERIIIDSIKGGDYSVDNIITQFCKEMSAC